MEPPHWSEGAVGTGGGSSSHERGLALEAMVEKILQEEGFATVMRQRLLDKSGIRHELDIVGTKGRLTKAVECKNRVGRPIGTDDVRNFLQKLTLLEIPNGLFVAYDRLSSDAMELCKSQGIEVWDHEILKEKYIEAVAGRLEVASAKVVDLALEPKVDFMSASAAHLANPNLLKVASANLVLHPYVAVEYKLRFIGKDPNHEEHKIAGDGTFVFDGLTGDLVGAYDTDGRDQNFRALSSGETKEQRKVVGMVLDDLKSRRPISNLRLARDAGFRLSVLEAEVDEKELETSTKDTVAEEHEEQVTYRVRGGRSDGERRTHTLAPKPKHVEVRSVKTIHVPFWDLRFESGVHAYARRIIASSGQIIEDQLALCPKHLGIGGITFLKKPTSALCESCGGAYCADHAVLAPDGHYYCDAHTPPQFRPAKTGLFQKALGFMR